MTDGSPIPIRVGVAKMLPVVAEGLRAWLVADPRLVMVELGAPASDADVLVLDPGQPRDGALAHIAALALAGARVVAFPSPRRGTLSGRFSRRVPRPSSPKVRIAGA